jgi:hypothetical protein
MEKFGFTEREARVSIYLDEAENLLTELELETFPGPNIGHIVWRETHVREHFRALHRQLAIRVLRRDYPEGWGYRPAEGDEEED